MNPLQPYLEIHQADVFQGSRQVFNALDLTLYYVQHTVILGPNGAGKSTLIKLLTRELYPRVTDNSYVKIDGSERVIIWELRKKIGLVSQDIQAGYDGHIKAQDVVLSGLFGSVGMHMHQLPSPEQIQAAAEALAQVGLSDCAERYYAHLSTGQQRRLLLARALIHKPRVLILDEPTNGLDLQGAFALIQLLRRLAQTGVSIVLVTHHLGEIIPEITRVVLLQEGQIVADGDKAEVLTESNLTALYNTPLRLTQADGFYQAYPQSS
ncbi:MAG TPA: ATP-binding cassette domain-containing protein [Cellvibrionaceae bacterium]|nr:ATP-binding cassette domain-containing protein [Cellvibrionaceae bacterium]